MKNSILQFALLLILSTGFNNTKSVAMPSGNLSGDGNSLLVINAFDSVFFDVSQAIVAGTIVEIPVYIKTDDIINAVDFEFKYNHSSLDFDTILFQAPYIEGLSFYNTNDSTVRLTSFSFSQPYANDSLLFKIRFNLLSGTQICANDLNSVASLLNGDACSAWVTDCLSSVNETDYLEGVEIYPNPTSDVLILSAPVKTNVTLYDSQSRMIKQINYEMPGSSIQVDITDLPSGVYIIRFSTSSASRTERIIKL